MKEKNKKKDIQQEKKADKYESETENYRDFMKYLHDVVEMTEKMQKQGNFTNLAKLSSTSIAVLMCIPPESCSNFKEITTKLSLAKSTMTGIISRLESLGYLTQKVSEEDQRIHELYLTELGKMTQQEHNEYETQIYQIVTGKLKGGERRQLLELLQKGFSLPAPQDTEK